MPTNSKEDRKIEEGNKWHEKNRQIKSKMTDLNVHIFYSCIMNKHKCSGLNL